MQDILFRLQLPCEWFTHDDSGWDIGAYQAVANTLNCDFMVGFGGPTHFRRAGWLKRMREVWQQCGDGLYGCLASYERHPHIITNGFWCNPDLIRKYPKRVITYDERAEFESSDKSLTYLAVSLGLPVRLVTWDGIYGIPDFRKAPNIFRRGDQSNCMSFYRHTEIYESTSPGRGPGERAWLAALADTLVCALPGTLSDRRYTEIPCAANPCLSNLNQQCATPSRCKISSDGRCAGYKLRPART
jgi:hypothetical protein